MDYVKLNNGFEIPQAGIGTYKVTEQNDINTLIDSAVESGYEMFDTASFYFNEEMIGNYLNNNSDLKKKLIFSTKVWPIDFDPDNTKRSIERSLNTLGLDKIGVMFLHWPSEGFVEAWKVLEKYYEQKVFDSIAVCNFHKQHMDKLLANANIPPVMDQLELHPFLSQVEMSEYLDKHNIKIESWAPLARASKELFENETIESLASKYNKTSGQIVLKWHLENGKIIIPKSVQPERIKENIDLFDFSLTKDEIISIDKLNKNVRTSRNPDDDQWLHDIKTGAAK